MRGERIQAENVTAGYGGDPVIRGVSVQAEPGQVVSLVGPNGSGKSTLLKSLVGIVRVSAGRVLVGDRVVTNLAPEEVARAGVGYVPQVDDVFGPLSVRENLEMGGYLLAKKEVGPRIEHVLTVFPRLATMLQRPAGKLSGGERKMLAMGRVLMLEPAIFLLDEPTANLAPAIAASLLTDHVRQLAERGAAVLIVEQRAKAVLAISDRTYVLGGGQLRMEGTPAELAGSPPSSSRSSAAAPAGPLRPARRKRAATATGSGSAWGRRGLSGNHGLSRNHGQQQVGRAGAAGDQRRLAAERVSRPVGRLGMHEDSVAAHRDAERARPRPVAGQLEVSPLHGSRRAGSRPG